MIRTNSPLWLVIVPLISNTANIREVRTSEEEPVFVQSIGIEENTIDKFLKEITIVGRIPEPIRVARLIATAEKYD